MPSPFPGMDPYLESRSLWRGVHHQLITALAAALNAALPPDFVARIDVRHYVLEPERWEVVKVEASAGADAHFLLRGFPEEVREAFIEIIAVNAPGHVVTAIELLSPANKTPGTGQEEYRRKQRDVLGSETHLLEIDLLRGGTHTVAVPEQALRALHGPWDYLTCLHRAGHRWQYEVWPRSLRQRLPRVLVPLTEGHAGVPLDLQAALDRVYDEGAFDRSMDYRHDPNPPLSADDAASVDALLREKGLRP
jgi:hypothetical protein